MNDIVKMIGTLIESKMSFFERQDYINAFNEMLKVQQELLDRDIVEETKNRT